MTLEQRLILARAHSRSIFLPDEGLGLGPALVQEGAGQEPGYSQGQGLGLEVGEEPWRRFNSSLPADDVHSTRSTGHRLRLGFISYDFNDHPTAHLVEAIFDVVRRRMGETAGREDLHDTTTTTAATTTTTAAAKTTHQHQPLPRQQVFRSSHLTVYSYGHNDNSSYRTRLETLADDFVDLAHVAHAQAR